MKTTERCTAVDENRRCSRSSKDPGGAKGLCPMHYQRAKRTGSEQRTQAVLGDSTQVVCLLPTVHHAKLVKLAEKRDVPLASLLRHAVATYLESAK